MKYLSEETIEDYKTKYEHPKELIAEKGLNYPTISYESDVGLAWEEFNKCFNEKYKKSWDEKLRMKVAEGKTCYSVIGRN